MTIHERIKNRRKECGLTVEEVAKKLGVSRATVYRYESAEIENMGIDKIEPLARVLNTSPAHLMGWDTDAWNNISSQRASWKIPLTQIAYELDIPIEQLMEWETNGADNEILEKYRKIVELLSKSANAEKKISIQVNILQSFLLEQLNKLTTEGQQKVGEYIFDLLQNKRYKLGNE